MFTMAEYYKGCDKVQRREWGYWSGFNRGWLACKKWNICQGKVLAGLPKPPPSKRGMERGRNRKRERKLLIKKQEDREKYAVTRQQNQKRAAVYPPPSVYAASSLKKSSHGLSFPNQLAFTQLETSAALHCSAEQIFVWHEWVWI